ncbi:MAG: D-alanyl-D-alanine carboxypeptidase, partial [Treponema sp.]|nr:D-alanyl-D-alanine carboxypeptidase [Treponema sp.]
MNKKTCVFLLFLFLPLCLCAQYFYTPPLLLPYIEDAPEIGSLAAVLIDAATGALLYSKNPNKEIPPASLAKLMTIHLLLREIKEGRASYDELIPITAESWAQNQPPRSSLMFLEPGQIVTLREILLGLAIPSGNDAATAAALRLTPTINDFANLMSAEAARMGLRVTRFVDASGFSPHNKTTAQEFAYFCYQYIKMHPNSMRDFHSHTVFSYPLEANMPQGRRTNTTTITQSNRNGLIGTFPGADGLKTGFIPESGYNIALTAGRDQSRFILVLLGAPSNQEGARIRQADGKRLLTWAFDNFKTVSVDVGQIEDVRLWKGRENYVQLTINKE